MPKQPEYTIDQADDLAKHFLGPEWIAQESSQYGKSYYSVRLAKHKWAKMPPLGESFVGESWREAFRHAGVKLPLRPRYANVGLRVLAGPNEIAVCHTNSPADRIARALNKLEAA